MGKTAFLFSGQGSQYAGMGRELCENFTQANEVYEQASAQFGYDVLKLSCEGDEQKLSQTAVSQPLIFTLSMAGFAVLRANGVPFDAVAGFSLGEVSALCASGAMPLKTGFEVIAHRAAAMQQAAEQTPGAMFAVLGAEDAVVEEDCARASEQVGNVCAPVNYNCPGQIVIAGEELAVSTAAELLRGRGLKVVRLAVNAAFHSPLMKDAAGRFYDEIHDIAIGRPACTFYSNVTGGAAALDDAPSYLRTQMQSPVRFAQEMQAMAKDGIDTFVELGPGKTLCGFLRRGYKGAASYNIEDLKSAQKCIEALHVAD